MSREEAIEIIRKEYACVDADCDIERSCGKCELHMPSKEPILKAYEMAIQALSQEPCEKCEVGNPCLYCEHEFSQKIEPCDDMISREAVCKMICAEFVNPQDGMQEWRNAVNDVVENILHKAEQLPSVTQKSGKWIDREVYDADRWKCSACGRTEPYREDYCPNCGADMRGAE